MNRLILAALITVIAGCSAAVPTAAPTPTLAPTPVPTTAPTVAPTLIARGTFKNKGANVELEATGEGASVDGTMTMSDVDFSFTVDLECTRTTPGGLILIGGDVTDSDFELAPDGSRAAIVLKPGSPVEAHPDFEPIPSAGTCMEYLESLTDEQATPDLEPIVQGTIELGP
jgi:hypothetical protein